MSRDCKFQFERLWVAPNFGCAPAVSGGYNLYWEATAWKFTATYVPEYSFDGEDWTAAVGSPTANLFALNVGPPRTSVLGSPVFRLKAFNGATLRFTSEPFDSRNRLAKSDYLVWREIVRRETLGLNKFTGINGFLLRKIVQGAKCTTCLDEVTGEPSMSNCPTCFGTGYLGGYHTPMPLRGDWTSSPPASSETKQEGTGIVDSHVAVVHALPFPLAKFGDVWVDIATNIRYYVAKPTEENQYRGVPTSQEITVSRLPVSDAAYKVPVTLTPQIP